VDVWVIISGFVTDALSLRGLKFINIILRHQITALAVSDVWESDPGSTLCLFLNHSLSPYLPVMAHQLKGEPPFILQLLEATMSNFHVAVYWRLHAWNTLGLWAKLSSLTVWYTQRGLFNCSKTTRSENTAIMRESFSLFFMDLSLSLLFIRIYRVVYAHISHINQESRKMSIYRLYYEKWIVRCPGFELLAILKFQAFYLN